MQKRILFVDDERSVLDGLRRSLHRYRDRWEARFAEGGEAALRELEAAPFDIVVSDMRMPGMDGYALLAHVREHYPHALRLILSGQTERDVALRSAAVSHQFLAKPCEGEQLRRVLDRACAIRELCQDEHQRSVLSSVKALPSAPGLYLQLTEAIGREETSAGDVAKIIEGDMAMCTKILQLVNSAYIGLPREIAKIGDAVAFLGMDTIRSLALAEGAFTALQGSPSFSNQDLLREQHRALLTASVARRLCSDPRNREQASLAGMLHDIGVLVLATQFPGEFGRFRAAEHRSESGLSPEQGLFGTTHAKVGAFLLGSWGLPIRVTEAVAFHHDPGLVEHEEFEVVTAVHVASALVGELVPNHTLGTSKTTLDEDYLGRLGLRDRIQAWRDVAHSIVERTQDGNNPT